MNRVLFYGDSNVFGFDPRGMTGGRYPAAERWTQLLSKKLYGEWKVFDDGMNGRIIPDNPYSFLAMDKAVLEHSPLDLFVVMLGTNDLLGMANPDADVVAGRMRDLIERQMRRQEFIDNRTAILIVSPMTIRPNMDDFLTECEGQRRRLATQIDMIAQEFGCFYTDAGSWDLDMAFDGIHLSEEGHAEFARQMAQVLGDLDLTAERREADDIVFA